MYDYILKFESEEQARTVLEFPVNEAGEPETVLPPVWNVGVQSYAPIKLYRQVEDEAEYVDGFWLAVYSPEQDEELWQQDYCVVEAFRDEELFRRSKLPHAIMENVFITPMPAGSKYIPVPPEE